MNRRLMPAARALCLALLSASLLPTSASAQPAPVRLRPAATQSVGVSVVQPAPSIEPGDPFRADVEVSLAAPAEYFEVRMRLRSPSGGLLYQKTEVRADLPAGRHVVSYEHAFAGMRLEMGRYPIEVRVLASGSQPTTVEGRLLVVPPGTRPLPVAVVCRLTGAPSVGGDGRFTLDPATNTGVRDTLAALARLASDTDEPLALLAPPVLIEELVRASGGYETSATAAGAEADVPQRYASAVAALRSAVATAGLTLVDAPYAVPDVSGLALLGALEDLSAQFLRTDAVLGQALGSTTASTTAFIGPALSPEVLTALQTRGTPAVLVPRTAVRTGEATAAPGCYALDDSPVRLIAVDDAASSAAAGGADAFYSTLFERLSAGDTDCVVLLIDVGDESGTTPTTIRRTLEWIGEAPWLEAASLETAVAAEPATATLAPLPVSAAPPGYWGDVASARESWVGYARAVGAEDADARAVGDAVFAAESTLWSGPAGDWGDADRGRAYAESARQFVTDSFSTVRIDARDVTLSSRTGDVPLTVVNGTGKPLALTLSADAEALRVREADADVDLEPEETFLTVPVDVQAVISDELHVTLRSGALVVAETTLTVRASYLDRFAILGMVVLVLIGLLFFIHRRVREANAGNIPDSADREV